MNYRKFIGQSFNNIMNELNEEENNNETVEKMKEIRIKNDIMKKKQFKKIEKRYRDDYNLEE